MQSQPRVNELEATIGKLKDKIMLSKAGKSEEYKSELKKNENLYAEYYQLRSDQCVSLKTQWEQYQSEQKQNRQKDIDKRQVDFDKELNTVDAARRRKWKVEDTDTLTDERKREIYSELFSKLKIINEQEEENRNDCPSGTNALITIPIDLLEYFWLLNIQVPITKSELLQSLLSIEGYLA